MRDERERKQPYVWKEWLMRARELVGTVPPG